MIGEVLRKAFALAHSRLLLILVDMLWKTIWLAITLAMVFLAVTWVGGSLRSLEWGSTNIPALDTLIAGSLLRQLWRANAARIALAATGILLASAVTWLILEAYFRSRMLAANGDRVGDFNLFLLSSVLKLATFNSAAMFLGAVVLGRFFSSPLVQWPLIWSEARGAALISVVILVFLVYMLVTLDTLVRSDAIELLGTDLLRVSGVIGILFALEAFVLWAAGSALLAGFLNVSRLRELVATLGFVAAAIAFLSMFHSYLLVVRYSAVAIMKQTLHS